MINLSLYQTIARSTLTAHLSPCRQLGYSPSWTGLDGANLGYGGSVEAVPPVVGVSYMTWLTMPTINILYKDYGSVSTAFGNIGIGKWPNDINVSKLTWLLPTHHLRSELS